jgi:hypothetical protein
MRRAVLAIGGLAASTTLLVVIKGAPAATEAAQSGAAGRSGAASAPAGAGPTPRPGERSGQPAGKRTGAPPKPPAGPFKVTGSVASNEYGNVRVQVTMTGTNITAVNALEMPTSSADSVRRSGTVKATMGAQAVRRDSADLDTVSGATATSESYRQSLQAALDRAARGEHD